MEFLALNAIKEWATYLKKVKGLYILKRNQSRRATYLNNFIQAKGFQHSDVREEIETVESELFCHENN